MINSWIYGEKKKFDSCFFINASVLCFILIRYLKKSLWNPEQNDENGFASELDYSIYLVLLAILTTASKRCLQEIISEDFIVCIETEELFCSKRVCFIYTVLLTS